MHLINNKPFNQPHGVTCPKCGFKHFATTRSRVKLACWSSAPLLILLGGFGFEAAEAQLLKVLQGTLLYFLFILYIVWPMLIKVEKWGSWSSQLNLPDSRLQGYFTYIVLPIFYVLFCLLLGKLFFS